MTASIYRHIAGWSSSVARRAHNPKVVGSNPSPATTASRRRQDVHLTLWGAFALCPRRRQYQKCHTLKRAGRFKPKWPAFLIIILI